MGQLDTLIQQKIDGDKDFQTSLVGLSDDDKNAKLQEKRTELIENEFLFLRGAEEKLSKSDELVKNYKTRAEKAEKDLKKYEGGHQDKKSDDIPSTDLIALITAKVHPDDVDWVVKQAKLQEKSASEILKDEEITAVLNLRTEKRKTAEATNTGTSGGGSKRPTGDELIKGLSEGQIPKPGTLEAEELFWARRGQKK